MTTTVIICCYLGLLLLLGLVSNRFFRGTTADYFVASRGIGPFLLLMSLFGTTMTAFALLGSTGASFKDGIGIYGKLASSSGIVHALCFFLIGVKLWSLGAKHGYLTQIQFFRDRFQSDFIGLLLFPILVGLVIPYLLVGLIGAGSTFSSASDGKVSFEAGAAIICIVVLIYIFFGGARGTAWANCFQTIVFIALGMVAFAIISSKLGGPVAATAAVAERNPSKLQRSAHQKDLEKFQAALKAYEAAQANAATNTNSTTGTPPETATLTPPKEPKGLPQLVFLSYMLIPLSVGMFPHIFQHWLTAKSASSFKLPVIAHPLLILLVWVPTVLLGTWATSAMVNGQPLIPPGSSPNAVLSIMVNELTTPVLGGFLTAGIMAAIMSSLDSQFLCLGSIFTNDIYLHYKRDKEIGEQQKVLASRIFVVGVVVVAYLIACYLKNTREIFFLGIWCFSGFAALVPLVVAALYWRRVTPAGAYASILTTAVAWIWLFVQSDFGANRGFLFLGMMPVASLVIASTIALVVVSLATPRMDDKVLEKFFPSK
ncbi:MAG: sodium:proline symporter [Verrucomicrobiales bacterium]|nr:sodium:proline symporter [Verrucomicrobiales bacterium]|tara:strand:+ start:1517 stop:3142 length:1626 start_codon:yes stop_codon:yes gene_type:complete